MADSDRIKWDEKYARGEHASDVPSQVLWELDVWLPDRGRALEIAGGAGRHALWLAARGLDVTLADISPVALALARGRAAGRGVPLTTMAVDLEAEPFPAGPWDLIFSHHYLWRPLFAVFPRMLTPGGRLVVIQPTVCNLERHARPPLPFLLEKDELRELLSPLAIEHYVEGWNVEERHEAVAVARLLDLD